MTFFNNCNFKNLIFIVFILSSKTILAQDAALESQFTHQDSLRGSIGKGRSKWDVLHYNITVQPDYLNKTISGKNSITIMDSGIKVMQIDLQEPMVLDSVISSNKSYTFQREQNVYWITINSIENKTPQKKIITFYFHGKPKEAVNAPWDGGWIWKKDKNNNPWISVACQGLGASVWYPCKDSQEDEPDNGATLNIIVPDTLNAIGNGRLKTQQKLDNHLMQYTWEVTSPINNYNIVPYIGKYKHFSEKYQGLKGRLDMDYWVLDYNIDKAKHQFKDAKKMMKAFEYWFGPYPFYNDGYKLVEAPHLGMEHQSAVAYGNQYANGYLGRDLSNTGWGLKWDFIIIHESGHEWFGNNITAKDIADMWVQEGFTNYSESLFTEFYYGKKAGSEYAIGLRNRISNDKNIIGPYGVNKEGSGDMYDKAGNMIHTIRQIINNDSIFRSILTGLNSRFYHQTVTTAEIENYISKKARIDFSGIFDQYMRTTNIPVLEYSFENGQLFYKWNNTVPKFKMPVSVRFDNDKNENWLTPETKWKSISLKNKNVKHLIVNENFYLKSKNVKKHQDD